MKELKCIFERLTLSRLRLLAELAEGYSAPEIADRLCISPDGARSLIDDLRGITAMSEAAEIGRWWRREGGPKYIRFIAEVACIDLRLVLG